MMRALYHRLFPFSARHAGVPGLAEPTPQDRARAALAADVKVRVAALAEYRVNRDRRLSPERKAHIAAVLGGFVRPRHG